MVESSSSPVTGTGKKKSNQWLEPDAWDGERIEGDETKGFLSGLRRFCLSKQAMLSRKGYTRGGKREN